MFLTCSAVRRRLPAFYDRELPVQDMIAIGGQHPLSPVPQSTFDPGE